VGAVAGNLIGDPRDYGLDAAVGGAFLALLWPRLADGRKRVLAVCAAAVALGVVPVTAAGVPVLVAGGVALLAGILTVAAEDSTELPRR
jgi:predicted branched-subunit amino acid permease